MADVFFKNLTPEQRKAMETATRKLQENKVELKQDSYGQQTPPRRAERVNTAEPKLNETVFPNQHQGKQEQRGAQLIQEKRDEAKKLKAPEAGKDQIGRAHV